MDDPVFDPWGYDPEVPPPAPPGNRWRAPSNLTPTPPPAPRSSPRSAAAEGRRTSVLPRARLAGTAGFLRTMSVPRIEEIAQRLQLARHRAIVQDSLDGAPPMVRLTVHPWRGPWTEKLSPPVGIFELQVEAGAEEQLIVRIRVGGAAEEPTEEVRLQPSRLSAAWLDARILDFVAKLLARA